MSGWDDGGLDDGELDDGGDAGFGGGAFAAGGPSFPDLGPEARAALDRLRSFCSMLPETAEIDGLGNPTFRVAVKQFAVFEVVDGSPTVCVKLDLDRQADLLARDGFHVEPHTGHYGWTVIDTGVVSWGEIDELVVESYRLVAPPEFVAQLDELLGG